MTENRWRMPGGERLTGATSRVHGAVSWAVEHTAAQVEDVGEAIGEAANVVTGLIAAKEGPEVPLHGAWSVGLGEIVSGHPGLPGNLRLVARTLNRFGYLQISPDGIDVDGEAVLWEKIDEITFAPAVEVLTAGAVQVEVERLTARLPPLPGRKWLVRQVVEVFLALCRAGHDAVKEGNATGADDTDIGIPVTIVHRGSLRRRKELPPGVFVALAAASIPNVSQAIIAVARERGVKVTVTPPSGVSRKAAVLRNIAASLSDRFGRSGEPQAVESGAETSSTATEPGEGEGSAV
jgi:hypothetical protein